MATTVTVEINDLDEKVLLDNLLDIDGWVQLAVIGKINNCKKRMAIQPLLYYPHHSKYSNPLIVECFLVLVLLYHLCELFLVQDDTQVFLLLILDGYS